MDMSGFLLKQTVSYHVSKYYPLFSLFYMHLKHLTELTTTCCLLN